MPTNDPSLSSVDGIAALLDECIGEAGVAVEYGWVCLGTAFQRGSRKLSAEDYIANVRERTDAVDLWANVTVDEEDVRRYLIADASTHLEPGQRFEIRKKFPTNYGRTQGMCWYRNAAMDKRGTWGRTPQGKVDGDGYFLMGEYTVPGAGDAA